jgi:diguanylate cyclase (GGDEF)-like protein
MPRFPASRSGPADSGLFTTEEVHGLMVAECFRAQRYGNALCSMVIGIDRLDHLGDLYGYESRATILAQVAALLRSSIRESDWLCARGDGAFEALFPHTGRAQGPSIARRLLERARRLVFDEGASTIQISLCIGIASRESGEDPELEDLLGEARSAQEWAAAAGGNRFRPWVKEPKPDPVVVSVPTPGPALDPSLLDATLTGSFEKLTRALENLLSRRVRELFEEMGEKLPDFGDREREVLELAVKKLEVEHEQRRRAHESEVDVLRRRLTKLSDSLELTEEELRRVMKMKAIDPGVASIYRTVQGLDAEDADVELKKEMMSAIFSANLELQSQFRDQKR